MLAVLQKKASSCLFSMMTTNMVGCHYNIDDPGKGVLFIPIPKSQSLTVSLQSQVHQLPRISQMIKQLSTEGILGEKEAYFTELCLSEAVINCIHHAYHGRPDGNIDIRIFIGDNHVTIDVNDKGTPLPPNFLDNYKRQAVEFDAADITGLPETGRGLALILNHMDSVAYFSKSGRNTLRMKLNIGGQ